MSWTNYLGLLPATVFYRRLNKLHSAKGSPYVDNCAYPTKVEKNPSPPSLPPETSKEHLVRTKACDDTPPNIHIVKECLQDLQQPKRFQMHAGGVATLIGQRHAASCVGHANSS